MNIVYEDSDILVINKPPGLAVDRSETSQGRETLQDQIVAAGYAPPKPSGDARVAAAEFHDRAGVVHRLDKDTSGLLVVAKTVEAFEDLKRQFKERKVKKRYWALVHDEVSPSSGTIDKPIGRAPRGVGKFVVVGDGRKAVTKYAVAVGHWPASRGAAQGAATTEYTLLDVEALTGRTHQIRVHLKSIGHPIVGDKIYASRRQQKEDKKIIDRQFLHAYRLAFEHPRTGEWMRFEVGLPKDLRQVLEKLT